MRFVELHVLGGGRAILEVSAIAGVLTPEGCQIMDPGTPTKPVRVLLRAGGEIDVIGDSAAMILTRCHVAIENARERKATDGVDFWIERLTPMGTADAAAG